MSSEWIGRRSWMARAAVATLVLGFVGCGDAEYPETQRKVIKIEALPETVLAAAKKALPAITFEDTWENLSKDGKVVESYEVRGKDSKGKIREVRIGLNGAILELE